MSETNTREVPLAALADAVGAHIDAVRGWIARNPTTYRGARRGRALVFSPREVLFFGLTKHLIDCGAPVAAALGLAAQHVDATPDDGPAFEDVMMYHKCSLTGDHRLYAYVHGIHEAAGPLSYSLIYTGRMWSVLQKRLAK